MNRLLPLVAALLCCLNANAIFYDVDFYTGGLGYSINDDGNSVTLIDAYYQNAEMASIDSEGDPVTDLVVPETVTYNSHTYTVTTIGSFIFVPYLHACEYQDFTYEPLKTVTIPNTVKRIESHAFVDCISLEKVDLGEGVEVINNAFCGCKSLTNIYFPKSLKTINPGAFSGTSISAYDIDGENPYLTVKDGVLYNKEVTILFSYPTIKAGNFTVPESVVAISGSAFAGCTGLKDLSIGDQVTFLGNSMLAYSSVENVRLPNNIKRIPYCFLEECVNVKSIDIPESVTIIDFEAFFGCSSLASVKMSEKVDTIGESAFAWCTSLREINLNARKVELNAFYRCDNLETIHFGKDFNNITLNWFSYCKSLKNLTIDPENPHYKMEGPCLLNAEGNILIGVLEEDVKMIAVPDGVTDIASYAFDVSRQLSMIHLPKSVTRLGDYLFHNLPDNTKVFCDASELQTAQKYTFTDKPNNLEIYFNADLYTTSALTENWKGVLVKKKFKYTDLNGDSNSDVSDISLMINLLLGKTEISGKNLRSYPDINLDGSVDVTDLNVITDKLLNTSYTLYYEPLNPSTPFPAGSYLTGHGNCELVYGGTKDNHPYYTMLMDEDGTSKKGICIYADKSKAGWFTINGIPSSGRLTFKYGDPFGVNNYTISAEVLSGGTVIKNERLKGDSTPKVRFYTCDYSFDGSGRIEIGNLSKVTNGHVAIWDIKIYKCNE